jgi:hypothetical protein
MRALLPGLLLLLPVFGSAPARAGTELVMFERSGCVWCRRWHDQVGVTYPLTDEGKRAPLVLHSLDRRADPPVKLGEPVRYTPTFILSINGVERARITGFMDEGSFYGLLARHLNEQKDLSADGK